MVSIEYKTQHTYEGDSKSAEWDLEKREFFFSHFS